MLEVISNNKLPSQLGDVSQGYIVWCVLLMTTLYINCVYKHNVPGKMGIYKSTLTNDNLYLCIWSI